jgi:hypothetical protein
MTISNDPIADDLIWGAAAIGREIGAKDDKRAHYLLGRRLIPARKVGRIWVASRQELRAKLCGRTAGSEVKIEQSGYQDGSGDLSPLAAADRVNLVEDAVAHRTDGAHVVGKQRRRPGTGGASKTPHQQLHHTGRRCRAKPQGARPTPAELRRAVLFLAPWRPR